jgi:AcrR family transcriptional regulator
VTVTDTDTPHTDSPRGRLLQAARALFVLAPYNRVSIRQIAAHAGVNSALISYYFKDKAGLFEAMFYETAAPVIGQLNLLAQNKSTCLSAELLNAYYRVMGQNPDLPKLLVSVLNNTQKNDPSRLIVEKFAKTIIRKFEKLIFNDIDTGSTLRAGLEPRKARMSFLSLMVFPFLAPPFMLNLLGITLNPEFLSELAQHNIDVLYQGLLMNNTDQTIC